MQSPIAMDIFILQSQEQLSSYVLPPVEDPLTQQPGSEPNKRSQRLIISSGDISDVDGFYAIAHYAKTTDADVLFMMNYPAYMKYFSSGDNRGELELGLGYEYDTMPYLDHTTHTLLACKPSEETVEKFLEYSKLAKYYSPDRYGMLNLLAFTMLKKVWEEVENPNKGSLYLGIGAINHINPFNFDILKNEAFVYASMVSDSDMQLSKALGNMALKDCISVNDNPKVTTGGCFELLGDRNEIYIDFNGSMAFLDEIWCARICEVRKQTRIMGAFVAGGVLAEVQPQTKPSIPGVLNRLSCSTMNQLYAPSKSATFFCLMASCGIPVYTVANNRVEAFRDGWEKFLIANNIYSKSLAKMAELYYTSVYKPPQKPFDFYTALALTQAMSQGEELGGIEKKLFFDYKYGVTLLSFEEDWLSTVAQYESSIPSESKPIYAKELALLKTMPMKTKSIEVIDLQFTTDASGKLSIVVEF